MTIRSIKNLNLRNKIVLLRVNFDVPVKNGRVIDSLRILAHLPTISFLLKKGAKIILISHLGRPLENKKLNLKNKKYILKLKKQYSLKPIYLYLKKTRALNKVKCSAEHKKKFCALVKNLKFIGSLDKIKIKKEIEKMKAGEMVLLENLRFWSGEEKNDKNFAKFLASLAEIYINDAFAICHRRHSSVSAITKYLPSYAGLLLEKEINNLSEVLAKPKKPFIVLMGGAKISTKLPVLKNLAKKADKILIGGALANDLLEAEGYNIGQSLSEKGIAQLIKDLRSKFKEKIVLPTDVMIKIKNKRKKIKISELNQFKDFRILDIGQETIKLFAKYLQSAKMIIWNGPMGLFEEKPFDFGTKELAKIILSARGGKNISPRLTRLGREKAKIIIGGGETIAALKIKISARGESVLSGKNEKIKNNIYISTGGGAMLEFLSGRKLPGIKGLIGK